MTWGVQDTAHTGDHRPSGNRDKERGRGERHQGNNGFQKIEVMTNEKFISLSKHYATKYLTETTELWIYSWYGCQRCSRTGSVS